MRRGGAFAFNRGRNLVRPRGRAAGDLLTPASSAANGAETVSTTGRAAAARQGNKVNKTLRAGPVTINGTRARHPCESLETPCPTVHAPHRPRVASRLRASRCSRLRVNRAGEAAAARRALDAVRAEASARAAPEILADAEARLAPQARPALPGRVLMPEPRTRWLEVGEEQPAPSAALGVLPAEPGREAAAARRRALGEAAARHR